MIRRYTRTLDPGDTAKEDKSAEHQAEAGKDDTCRCKEVSEMTPRQLLRTMFSDLAFWKKTKKG